MFSSHAGVLKLWAKGGYLYRSEGRSEVLARSGRHLAVKQRRDDRFVWLLKRIEQDLCTRAQRREGVKSATWVDFGWRNLERTFVHASNTSRKKFRMPSSFRPSCKRMSLTE